MNVLWMTNRGTFIRNGTETTMAKQFRLVPAVYTRRTDDGRLESQFNVRSRTGPQFRLFMEPKTSVFYMRYGGRKIPLLPILKAMGHDSDDLKARWGEDIYEKNKEQENSPHAISFIRSFQDTEEAQEKAAAIQTTNVAQYNESARRNLLEKFNKMELDDIATESTLGKPYKNVNTDAMADATSKILGLSRGEVQSDDRDSLEYQRVHDISDFLAEKITHDQGGLMRSLMWKFTNKNGDLAAMPPGVFDKHVNYVFNSSGLGQNLEAINPFDALDQGQRISRLGEGGIASVDQVPKEARNVQPSYANFVDPVRAPESLKIGVDMKFARNVRKGKNGLLYTQFLNPKTGGKDWVDSRTASRSILAFPESLEAEGNYVMAMTKARGMFYVPRDEVDYVVPNGDDLFSIGANTVPLKSGVKGMRLLMGSKFVNQALPLVSREAPFVQTTDEDGIESTERRLGSHLGAVRAEQPGVVTAVRKDRIDVQYQDGTKGSHDLYEDFPFNRKTGIRNMPAVKAGQQFGKGDLLASSNYTDDEGVSALGRNMRVAYMNYDGKVFEDAIVISEKAAKTLTSEHMYHDALDVDDDTKVGKSAFRNLYPGKYNKEQMEKLDDRGLVKPGTILNYGDPLFVAYKENEPSPGSMGRRKRKDVSVTWKHHYPGVVTDSAEGKNGFKTYVRANAPMRVGDKLSNRFGGKGVISDIVPDEHMPRDAKGRSYEVLLSPLGIISRTNSSQMVEAALGKIAEKTGESYVLPGFSDDDMVDFALNELKKHNLKDKDDVYDPRTKKNIPGIFAGNSYFYKLQHTSEAKGKARSISSYTQDEQPAKGGKTGAKHIGDMEIQAILAHGAGNVLKDLKIIKGQKNDDFWRQLKLGETPTMPGTPLVYEKFKALIRGAGVELREGKSSDDIFAMTNAKAQVLTGEREIKNARTYGSHTNKPLEGGLFDPDATGSLNKGDRWSYIKLPEPMPNPVMIEPMRSILGLKQKEFQELVAGGKEVNGKRGPAALTEMLKKIDIPTDKANAIDDIKYGSKAKRDSAVKRLNYLDALEKQNVKLSDFMMDRVPVLPPRFRRITKAAGMTMVADPNYMYKTLLESIEDFKDSDGLSDNIRNEARGQVFENYKALVGLTDPKQEKLVQKKVGGILQQVFGKGSPKAGFVQRRVIGTNIDVSGLGVITPNPSLKLNEVGMPEDQAWNLYEPFIIRHLVQNGTPATVAARSVANHEKNAYAALKEVIKERPVLINRAPTLHKYNIMAFNPVLTKGSTLQVPPAIVKPFAADFDGDTMAYSVPVSADAVREARDLMMPEKNLLSARNDKPNFAPSNEYLQGLYFATKAPKNEPTVTFDSLADAKKAYRNGEISIDTPIKIRG